MTGRENLEMVARLFGQGRRTARASAPHVLDQLGLGEAADRLVRTYSGGMRRRLDLGASLVGAPRLLLLDEPTTGLDPAQPHASSGTRSAPSSTTGTDVLLTTQYLDEADHLASQIVIIDHGRAIADGHACRAQAPRRRQRDRGARAQPRSTSPRSPMRSPACRRRRARRSTRRRGGSPSASTRPATTSRRRCDRSRPPVSRSTTSPCASPRWTRSSSPSRASP